jgi:hypothetical protein
LMRALGSLQREMREMWGYAPPPEVDFIDYPEPGSRWCEACQCYHMTGSHVVERHEVADSPVAPSDGTG